MKVSLKRILWPDEGKIKKNDVKIRKWLLFNTVSKIFNYLDNHRSLASVNNKLQLNVPVRITVPAYLQQILKTQ